MKKINFVLALALFLFCFFSGIYNVQALNNELIFNNTSSNIGPLTGNPVFNNSSTNSGTITGNATFNDLSINDTAGVVTGNACFATTAQNKGTVRGTITVCGVVSSGGGTTSGGSTGVVSVGTTSGGGRMSCKEGDKFSVTTGLPCPNFVINPIQKYCKINTRLTLGSKGSDVMCLQTTLSIKSDGVFGKLTEATVKAWQKKLGLIADGIFGVKSRGAWNNPQ